MSNSYPLVHLFTADIVQPAVQILDTLNNVLHLILVFSLDLAGLTNGKVDGEFDGAPGVAQPAGDSISLGCEANSVLAGIRRREVEAARVAITFGHNAVVIVEGLLNGNEHLQVVVDRVITGLRIEDFGLEATYYSSKNRNLAFIRSCRHSLGRTSHQSILGQVFEEALRLPALHIEVEGISGEKKRKEGKESQG